MLKTLFTAALDAEVAVAEKEPLKFTTEVTPRRVQVGLTERVPSILLPFMLPENMTGLIYPSSIFYCR